MCASVSLSFCKKLGTAASAACSSVTKNAKAAGVSVKSYCTKSRVAHLVMGSACTGAVLAVGHKLYHSPKAAEIFSKCVDFATDTALPFCKAHAPSLDSRQVSAGTAGAAVMLVVCAASFVFYRRSVQKELHKVRQDLAAATQAQTPQVSTPPSQAQELEQAKTAELTQVKEELTQVKTQLTAVQKERATYEKSVKAKWQKVQQTHKTTLEQVTQQRDQAAISAKQLTQVATQMTAERDAALKELAQIKEKSAQEVAAKAKTSTSQYAAIAKQMQSK